MTTTKDDLCIRELRSFLGERFMLTRNDLGVSQIEFANDLEIDRRSYLDIEHRKNLCCTLTLLRFLCYYCDDPLAVIAECRKILDRHSLPLHARKDEMGKAANDEAGT